MLRIIGVKTVQDGGMLTGSAFMLDGVWFLFPSKEPGDDNNVACNGQRIVVPAGRYRALHLIGAAENGSFKDVLKLAYREGPAEAELALTDWCQPPKFHERVAFAAAARYTYSPDLRRVVREEVRPRLFDADVGKGSVFFPKDIPDYATEGCSCAGL